MYWFIYNEFIPNAFDYNQNYDFSTINESKWQSVIVPLSLVMQGFDIENNTEYYYKQSTLWGNYWGRRFILNKQNSFEFSATFEN